MSGIGWSSTNIVVTEGKPAVPASLLVAVVGHVYRLAPVHGRSSDMEPLLELTIATFGAFYEDSFRSIVGDVIMANEHAQAACPRSATIRQRRECDRALGCAL